MNIKDAQKLIESEMSVLERGIFTFETVVQPRYEVDKKILRNLKDQHVKIIALAEKIKAGNEVTQQEIYDAVPAAFR